MYVIHNSAACIINNCYTKTGNKIEIWYLLIKLYVPTDELFLEGNYLLLNNKKKNHAKLLSRDLRFIDCTRTDKQINNYF